MGRLYNKAPGFPISIGDNKKSLECFEKALEFGPEFYLNHMFITELYISDRKYKKAKKHLEWILNADLSPNHEDEDTGYKQQAELLIKKV